MKNILIIGCGKLGSSLYRALQPKTDYSIHIYDINRSCLELGNFLPVTDFSHEMNASLIRKTDIIIISVPDHKIRSVIDHLSSFNLTNKIIFHTSGALSTDLFKPIEKNNVETGSLHPIQTFPKLFCSPDNWSGIWCTFEGTSQAAAEAQKICNNLEAKLLPVNREQKEAVHLAAVYGSNYTVALLGAAERILHSQGLDRKIMIPLLNGVLENFKSNPTKYILSGPIQRGDTDTVSRHLNLLSKSFFKAEKKLYRALAEYIITNPDFTINDAANLIKTLKSDDA